MPKQLFLNKKKIEGFNSLQKFQPLIHKGEKEEISNIVENSEESEKPSMAALFRNPVIRHMTMKCGFIWFSITMVYYVISLGKMPGFIPTNNVVNGLMELIILWLPFVSDKFWFHRSKVLSGKEVKYK